MLGASARAGWCSYTARKAVLSFRNLSRRFPAFRLRPLFSRHPRGLRRLNDRGFWERAGVDFPVMFRAQPEHESGGDKSERALFLRSENEELAPVLLCQRLHSERRLT